MRNFYYVVSFNLTNPRVKTMLEQQKITAMTGLMIDFKLRSKLFLSYVETVRAANDDFAKKLESLYPDDEKHHVSQFSVSNPSILAPSLDLMETLAQKFGGSYLSNWDENCCSVLFFADTPEDEEEEEEMNNLQPNSWMFKYEVMYTEDAIELSGNGDFVFSPMNVPRTSFTSTYH